MTFQDLLPFLALFAGSVLAVLVAVPILCGIARRTGLVDRPDQHRKLHSSSIPLVGGIAIFLSVATCCGLAILFFTPILFPQGIGGEKILQLTGMFVGAVILTGIGVIDDRYGVRGRQKLMAQILVAVILVGTGTWIYSVEIYNSKFQYKNAWTSTADEKLNDDFQKIDDDQTRQIAQVNSELESGYISSEQAEIRIAELTNQSKELKGSFASRMVLSRSLAIFAGIVTIMWIVGAINSVNLIDGADGLAGTTTFIISLSLAIIAYVSGDFVGAAVALSLSGALLGFLFFNFPPAKIFLGDAGSMLIGLLLAAISVQSFLKEAMIYICIAPLAMLFIPIFDSMTAFTRRVTTGRSIYSTDRGHLHHMLMRHGLSNRGMIFFVGGLTLITAVGAVLTVINASPYFSIIGVATVIVFLVSAKVFGWAEFRLLASRSFRFVRSFLKIGRGSQNPQSMTVQLQGSKEWHKLWEAITEFAERHRFLRIKLDLNLPWLHESFHADWDQRAKWGEDEETWQTRVPLAANGRVYGRMEVSGAVSDNESIYLVLMLLSDLLETLEPAIARLAEEKEDSVSMPKIQSRQEKERDEDQLPVASP